MSGRFDAFLPTPPPTPPQTKPVDNTRDLRAPSITTLPKARIFRNPPDSKPLEADLEARENWCPAGYKEDGLNGKNTIDGNFVKKWFPEQLKGGATKIQLIWHKDDLPGYWIGTFYIEKHTKERRNDIQFGPDATKYLLCQSEASAIHGEHHSHPTKTQHEATIDRAGTTHPSPVLYLICGSFIFAIVSVLVAAIVFLALLAPHPTAIVAIIVLGLVGVVALYIFYQLFKRF